VSLKPNYKFLLEKALACCDNKGRILDYGCGNGKIVEAGIALGLQMYGCEMFDHGSGIKIRESLYHRDLLGNAVFEMVEDKIPFPDNTFEMVLCNQVFEHVINLDAALFEIHRVLKTGGKLLCIFPVQECWRDHAGTFFTHKFKNSKRLQYMNLFFFRSLGLGSLKKGRGNPRHWAAFFVRWLEEHTCYRTVEEVDRIFKKYFLVSHIEEDYIRFRLNEKRIYRLDKCADTHFGRRMFQWFCNRWGGVVILAEKNI